MQVASLVAAALALVPRYYEVQWMLWEHTALSNASKHDHSQTPEQKQTHMKLTLGRSEV